MITTFILCGGESSRFDGDKARAAFGDTTLLEAVIAKTRGPILVVDEPGRFDWLSTQVPFLVDREPGGGPAAAIAHAIEHAKKRRLERIRVISCDMPTFEPAWWDVLEAHDGPAVAFHDDAGWQPLFSVFRPGEIDIRKSWRDEAVWKLLESVGAEKVSPPSDFDRLISVNTPEDLERARVIYQDPYE